MISLPGNDFQIVVREFAPLLSELALQLLPISLNLIPVHGSSSLLLWR
jgi:hypothetical protein